MFTVTEYQQKFDEISEICRQQKSDFTMSNAKKRELYEQYRLAFDDLRASKASLVKGISSRDASVTWWEIAKAPSITTLSSYHPLRRKALLICKAVGKDCILSGAYRS